MPKADNVGISKSHPSTNSVRTSTYAEKTGAGYSKLMEITGIVVGEGERVILTFHCKCRSTLAGGNVEFDFRRDDTNSLGYGMYSGEGHAADEDQNVAGITIDAPSAGTYKYAIYWAVTSGTAKVWHREFHVIVVKVG